MKKICSPPLISRLLDLILASNKVGLRLAKYLVNGVSTFISASVEGPDVTLRPSEMPRTFVVDIVAVGMRVTALWRFDDVREERSLSGPEGQVAAGS